MAETGGAWPELKWVPDWSGIAWLEERVKTVTLRVHAFEEGLARADRAGELKLRVMRDQLADWQEGAAHVRLYVAMMGEKRISLTELPFHAEELEKVYRSLDRARIKLLRQLPAASGSAVQKHESAVSIDFEEIRRSAPALATRKDDYGRLGEVLPPLLTLSGDGPRIKPVPLMPEEYMLRMQAESQRLPSHPSLSALLAFLPSAWLHAVFVSLAIRAPKRSAVEKAQKLDYAAMIQQHLADPSRLKGVIRRLDEQARLLLADLWDSGSMPYASVKVYYGSDDPDGYHWLRRLPSGPLGLVRRLGLAYVGKIGAEYRVTTPNDLHALHKQLWSTGP